MERLVRFYSDPVPWQVPAVTIVDRTIQGRHGVVPIRTYTPKQPPRSALVWLHGGGFSGGNLDMPEGHIVAAELSHRVSALVVSVDYRLAIDGVRYPVPVDDVHDVWAWVTSEIWPQNAGPAALGGASAGAALAVSVAMRLRDEAQRTPDSLLLGYPYLHFPTPPLDDVLWDEMKQLPDLARFSPASMEYMVQNYVGRISDIPREAMPGAGNVAGLPPTSIVVSEYDDLRPSAELFARQLQEAGTEVRSYLARGMLHGHLNRAPYLGEVDQSLAFLAAGITP
ncbi:alpha/beta hydrolase fold domain-containing protein [Paenarthrobacter nicotinovorans]|uniref:alpha/beta hydrolase fold domain-containing protein n=1 Tax=Paenarthrobacter nicotinovorans TaxID=29320 RepID=UPI003747DDEB